MTASVRTSHDDFCGSYTSGCGSYGSGKGYFAYSSADGQDTTASIQLQREYAEWDRERGARRLLLAGTSTEVIA